MANYGNDDDDDDEAEFSGLLGDREMTKEEGTITIIGGDGRDDNDDGVSISLRNQISWKNVNF